VLRRLTPVLIAVLVLAAACQSAATVTDPAEIITQGLDATANLKSFHMSLALNGTFNVPNSGGSFNLDSTSLEADIDVAAKNVHLTFGVPAFLGLAGDLVVIGNDLWVKTTITGKKWSHQTTGLTGTASPGAASSASPAESLDPQAMIAKVRDFLKKPGVVTKKLADVDCGDRKCYQVSVSVPSSLMTDAAAVASFDPSTVFGDALVLNLLFDRDKLWLTEVSSSVASDTMGSFSATLSFSKFDEAVTFSQPPSADVTEGEFTVPGM
jgi:hypothetical protein